MYQEPSSHNIILTLLAFTGFLFLQKALRTNKKYRSFSATMKMFSHMVGQDSTVFHYGSAKLISIVMTLGFFLIWSFYFNLMSTDLVVVHKPNVISNYRDVINSNKTVTFFAISSDVKEFETAKEGSIQEEFWEKFKKNYTTVRFGHSIEEITEMLTKALNGEYVGIMNSLFSNPLVKWTCKMKAVVQKDVLPLARIFGWISKVPDGKLHANGSIMRQGIKTEVTRKGKKRVRRLIENAVMQQAILETLERVDVGPMIEGTASIADIEKCMSKQVNYNKPEVETVSVENYKCLNVLCFFLHRFLCCSCF